MVKRYGNLWEKVVSIENITKAYHESRKGKTSKPGVRKVDEDPSTYILEIQRLLMTKEYRSGEYREFSIHEIDRHMKQVMHCHHYLRYMDDIVVLGKSKSWLRRVKKRMDQLLTESGLEMKSNWQIFPVESRGVDFVGYRTFHDFCLVRTRNKCKMKRAMRRLEAKLDAGQDLDEHDRGCLASWSGILGWCDSWRLSMKTIRRVKRKMEAREWMRSPQHRTRVPSSS